MKSQKQQTTFIFSDKLMSNIPENSLLLTNKYFCGLIIRLINLFPSDYFQIFLLTKSIRNTYLEGRS